MGLLFDVKSVIQDILFFHYFSPPHEIPSEADVYESEKDWIEPIREYEIP